MKKSTFRYIEAEIYDYPETLKEIGNLREEIMEGGQQEEQQVRVQTNRMSDPTVNRATRLLMDRRLRRLEEVTFAIQKVCDALPKDKHRLMEMKYWEKRYTNTGISETLHISEMTFYRWRRQIVTAIANELGLLNMKE